jgi:hypothetical protein
MFRRTILEINPDTGVIVRELHRQNWRLHRDPTEGPASIQRDAETGVVQGQAYYWNGRLHRSGGPAVISYNSKSVPIIEIYYHHGMMHRDPKEGPAKIERNNSGSLVLNECYCLYDRLYRDRADGPNQTQRFEDGRIDFEDYSEPGELPPSGRRPHRRPRPSAGAKPSP